MIYVSIMFVLLGAAGIGTGAAMIFEFMPSWYPWGWVMVGFLAIKIGESILSDLQKEQSQPDSVDELEN